MTRFPEENMLLGLIAKVNPEGGKNIEHPLVKQIENNYETEMKKYVGNQSYNHKNAFQKLVYDIRSNKVRFPLRKRIPTLLLEYHTGSVINEVDEDTFDTTWTTQTGKPYAWFVDGVVLNLLQTDPS